MTGVKDKNIVQTLLGDWRQGRFIYRRWEFLYTM